LEELYINSSPNQKNIKRRNKKAEGAGLAAGGILAATSANGN